MSGNLTTEMSSLFFLGCHLSDTCAAFFFQLNLLGWHWFENPYRSPAYNSTKHHLPLHGAPIASKSFSPQFSPSPTSIRPPPFSSGYNHTLLLNPLTYFQPAPLVPLPSDSCLSVPCVQASVSVLFIGAFYSLDFTCKWGPRVWLFLWRADFTCIMPSRSIMLSQRVRFSSFLTARSYSIVWMDHSFFIHSSADGHWGCLQISAVGNNAAVNIECLYSFKLVFHVSEDIFPEVGLQGHKEVPLLIFWGNSVLFSTVAAPVCMPINSVKGFPFPHILSSTCCLWICRWWPCWPVGGAISPWF